MENTDSKNSPTTLKKEEKRSSSSKHHHHSSKSKSKKEDKERYERRHSRERHRDKRSKHKHSKRRSSSSSSSSSVDSYKKRDKEDKYYKSTSRSDKRSNRYDESPRRRSRSRSRNCREREPEYKYDRNKRDETKNVDKPKKEINETNTNNLETKQENKLELNTENVLKKSEIPKEIQSNPKELAEFKAEQLRKKAEELTGVKIPSFYNSGAINPLVYAEQQKKRKLLWSKSKDNENTSTKLVGKAIVEGQDEKTAEKFRKLMGIKSDDLNEETKSISQSDQIQMMQKKAFEALDKEYEYARITTHLNRGKGLGFASHAANLLLDPNQRAQFQ